MVKKHYLCYTLSENDKHTHIHTWFLKYKTGMNENTIFDDRDILYDGSPIKEHIYIHTMEAPSVYAVIYTNCKLVDYVGLLLGIHVGHIVHGHETSKNCHHLKQAI